MRRLPLLLVALTMLLAAPTAGAAERQETYYSDAITVQAYVGEQVVVPQSPDGVHAPNRPGFITAIRQDVVDRRRPGARALPIQDVMVHHLVMGSFGPGGGPLSCGNRFFSRGEEDQSFDLPDGYGLPNRTADGKAPAWYLVHMLMNHRDEPRTVYVRTTITYEDAADLKPVQPWFIDSENCREDPVFDVPGNGRRGSTFVDTHRFTTPRSGRLIAAGGHLHGGGKYNRLVDDTCGRTLVDSRAYYGMPDHEFYRVKPVLHEASPVRIGIWQSAQGIPISAGAQLRLLAGYDNRDPHTRVMNILLGYFAPGPVDGCEPMPTDLVETNRPARFRSQPPPYRVPQFYRPGGKERKVGRKAIRVGSMFFNPARISARKGQRITWRFTGGTRHSVTVTGGPGSAPIAFSSPWLGGGATYSYRPRKRGTYKLFCSLHPAAMTQTLRVR
jgi:plastocyanin